MKKRTEASDKADKKLVRLTKIKQWYLPADAKSYKRLKKAGVPMLRFHENMLETVALVAKRKGIRAELVSFKEAILNPFLDRISDDWRGLHEDTRAKMDSKTIKLETTHKDALETVEPMLEDLKACVARFFDRWGYAFTFEASKKRDKILVHIEFWYSETKQPVLHIQDDPAEQQTFSVDLGFLKLEFSMDDQYLNTVIYKSMGGKMTAVDTSRCLYSQVGNIQPMIEGLMLLTKRDPEMAARVTPTVA